MNSVKTLQTKHQMGNVTASFCSLTVIRGGLFGQSSKENNWVFIDTQNLVKGVKEQGWIIDWKRFRSYLKENYSVTKAVLFMGRIPQNDWLYKMLTKAGFEIEFREVKQLNNGEIDGGNVDADLAGYVMDHKTKYSKAILIADDADYCNTIKSLQRQNKLKLIVSSHIMKQTSELIKRTVGEEMILSIHAIRNLIEFSKIPNKKNIKS